jgi:type II secretory pathway predicted ATPase ExeA
MRLEVAASSPGEGEMFVEFYSLREDPFRSLDPRVIFLSENHRKALAALHYGIERGDSIQLLLAEAGLGKTILLRHLQGRWQASARVSWSSAANFKESELPNRPGGTREKGQPNESQGMNGAKTHALEPERSRQIVLIDDAQDLGDMQLASLLVLAKAELSGTYNIHIILAGRPRLLEKLRKLNWANAREIRITPMNAAETKEYIGHRLRMAGSQPALFTPAAYAMIAEQSGGVPGLIDTISAKALAAGAKRRLQQIDSSTLDRNGANESGGLSMTLLDAEHQFIQEEQFAKLYDALAPAALPKRPRLAWAWLVLVLALVIAAAAGLWVERQAPPHPATDAGGDHTDFPDQAKPGFSGLSGPIVKAPPPRPSNGMQDNAARTRSASATSAPGPSTAPGATPPHQAIAVKRAADPAELSPLSHSSSAALPPTTVNAGAASYAPSSPARSIVPPSAASGVAIGLPHEKSHADAASSSPAPSPDAQRAQIYTKVGDDYMSMRKYDRAIEFYQDAAALAPSDDRIKKKLAEARIGALTR